MNHTPTPWAITKPKWTKKDWASLLDKNRETLMIKCQHPDELGWAVSQVWGDNDAEAKANAELIVKAVNSHQAMKEALIETHKVITQILTDSQLDERTDCGLKIREYMVKVENALTLANGGTPNE